MLARDLACLQHDIAIVPWSRLGRFPPHGHDSKNVLAESQAMKYLSWVLYPLVVGYGIYSLIYEPHKSWYSWLLNSLVGAVYTFGFILMCPQACTTPSHLTPPLLATYGIRLHGNSLCCFCTRHAHGL